MTNRYAEEFELGQIAYTDGERRHDNPHIWHSVAWYAWDAGWHVMRRVATKLEAIPDPALESSLERLGRLVRG